MILFKITRGICPTNLSKIHDSISRWSLKRTKLGKPDSFGRILLIEMAKVESITENFNCESIILRQINTKSNDFEISVRDEPLNDFFTF